MRAVRQAGMQEIITYSPECLPCPIKTNIYQNFMQGFVPSSAPIQTVVLKKECKRKKLEVGQALRHANWPLLGKHIPPNCLTWVPPALNQAIDSFFQAPCLTGYCLGFSVYSGLYLKQSYWESCCCAEPRIPVIWFLFATTAFALLVLSPTMC